MTKKVPALDEPLTEEEFQELLRRPRPDLDEALARGIEERAKARAAFVPPYIDLNKRYR